MKVSEIKTLEALSTLMATSASSVARNSGCQLVQFTVLCNNAPISFAWNPADNDYDVTVGTK